MTTPPYRNIHFEVNIALEQRGDYWAARIEPTGITVYGRTEQGAQRRAEASLEFFLKHVPDLPAYLDSHGIPYTVADPEPGSTEGTPTP